jgi:excisionase family DNA binding protein
MIVVDGVEMLEVRDAARLARRTPETVRRWVWSGRLEATKQGNRLLVRRSDVAALAGEGRSRLEPAEGPSLAEWAARARKRRGGTKGTTAADLVWDDRAGR